MEDQMFLEDPQKNDLFFYSENGMQCDMADLIEFDNANSDMECSELEHKCIEVHSSNHKVNKSSTDAVPAGITQVNPNCKQWQQREITIKTLESQFKVVMWTRNETDEEEDLQNNRKSPRKRSSPKRRPLKSSSNDSSRTSRLQPHTCPIETCQKIFKDAGTLRKHFHIHGPKTFICIECGRSFLEASKLKRHQLVHTGEKPFECGFAGCGKRFSLDFNLRTHVRIHTGVRPFVCSVAGCTKSFAQSTNLKSHLATHTKTKP